MSDTAANGAFPNEGFPSSRVAGSTRRHARNRRVGLYLGASLLWVLTIGLSVERFVILVWLFGLLAVAVAGDGSARMRSLAQDWSAFAVLLIVYRYSAGLADGVGRPVLVDSLVEIDRFLGFGEVPTVRLQQWFDQSGTAPLWQVPLSFVYVSHFFAVLVAAAVLWLRDRSGWIAYTKRLISLAVLAVATYVLFPAAPPWMAADRGLIPAVERSAFSGWERVGLGITEPLVEHGRAVANPVAALPSMHAGFALFLAWFFWDRCGVQGRVLWFGYAVSMAFTLVLTGEHWVADVILGWFFVGVVMVGWRALENRSGSQAAAEPGLST